MIWWTANTEKMIFVDVNGNAAEQWRKRKLCFLKHVHQLSLAIIKYTLLCYFHQLSASILFVVAGVFRESHEHSIRGILLVVRWSAWVLCVFSSSYSFSVPMVMKHCMCFCHCLKICKWFIYITHIDFSHFFRPSNIDLPGLNATNVSWYTWGTLCAHGFIPICLKLYIGSVHNLKMYTCLSYNPEIILSLDFMLLTLIFTGLSAVNIYRKAVPFVRISSYAFILIVLKLCI